MPLPELIEIIPLSGPVEALITVPGSKSITNRALVLAALADGEVTLNGALWSEDTQVMVEALRSLGFAVEVETDPDESCNRVLRVRGQGGDVPKAGTEAAPLEIFVGNAGTAARFLAALCCLGQGVYRLHGVERMHQRPQAALFSALRELGYRIDSPNDHLPAVIYGEGPKPGRCTVSIEESSQFASALLLCAQRAGWDVNIVGENAEESPYVHMTSELIKAFPAGEGEFQIEPDASSGSYFWAASWLLVSLEKMRRDASTRSIRLQRREAPDSAKPPAPTTVSFSHIGVSAWPATGWQIDQDFTIFIDERGDAPPTWISRERDLGDSIMTAIVLAPFTHHPVRFTHLGRLRLQECERVVALRTELTKCGARVDEKGDTLTVHPSRLHGAEIETYNDHRMAMCFAVLGLRIPGIQIRNPACVKKTFPNFFQKLAAAPPAGLGARVVDPSSGQALAEGDLFVG